MAFLLSGTGVHPGALALLSYSVDWLFEGPLPSPLSLILFPSWQVGIILGLGDHDVVTRRISQASIM